MTFTPTATSAPVMKTPPKKEWPCLPRLAVAALVLAVLIGALV